MNIVIISANKLHDEFMHHADVFEDFKRLGTPEVFEIRDDLDAAETVRKFREEAGKTRYVSAVFIQGTKIGWVDPSVRLVSNGRQFCPLESMLQAYGYTA